MLREFCFRFNESVHTSTDVVMKSWDHVHAARTIRSSVLEGSIQQLANRKEQLWSESASELYDRATAVCQQS
jgi:hypothetical protein